MYTSSELVERIESRAKALNIRKTEMLEACGCNRNTLTLRLERPWVQIPPGAPAKTPENPVFSGVFRFVCSLSRQSIVNCFSMCFLDFATHMIYLGIKMGIKLMFKIDKLNA